MNDDGGNTTYVRRGCEADVRQAARQVSSTGDSRVLLVYGSGGVGKTQLVRGLAADDDEPGTIWLDPVDVDDPKYWLLSNLENAVADQLDPERRYFGTYYEHLSRRPSFLRPGIGREAVQSHLQQIKREFADCYANFVGDSAKTVVITLDTVEVIRSSYSLRTLVGWMRSLPATLFVLSGRPWPRDAAGADPLREAIEQSDHPLPIDTLRLGGFEYAEALQYLGDSGLAAELDDTEIDTIVHLTRGHPLWLALTISYLATVGVPEEVTENDISDVRREVPFRGTPSTAGHDLHEAYRRRLVAPYRSTDFWHEAIKRMAVIRQNLSAGMFRELLHDREPPSESGTDRADGGERAATGSDARWQAAWDRLRRTAWVRVRSDGRYVTLHDVLAEELAHRVIPLHDQNGAWRRALWARAAQMYGRLVELPTRGLEREIAALEEDLDDEATTDRAAAFLAPELVDRTARLDIRKRELDLMTTARLYYRVLSDPSDGIGYFLELHRRASSRHDVLFRELICLEMQHLLPATGPVVAPPDVVGAALRTLHEWLAGAGVGSYIDVGLAISDHLIDDNQPRPAIELLERLPMERATVEQRYTASIRKGNALMRMSGQVPRAAEHFMAALHGVHELPVEQRRRWEAEALKELGFYHRNVGNWDEADAWYGRAQQLIGDLDPHRASRTDLEEFASICNNRAYVSALLGKYGKAKDLIGKAIGIRTRLGAEDALGFSYSVRGEIHRYERSFELAWESYREAVAIFENLRAEHRLGVVHQEQAICLFQAERAGVSLVDDMRGEAERLALAAVDICRDRAVRSYPSALNRAGRIIAERDPERGLDYLREGAAKAEEVADGWFQVSNLIEYMELSFRTWMRTGELHYCTAIVTSMRDVDKVLDNFGFPGLRGRWDLIRGHLAVVDSLRTDNPKILERALYHYSQGFRSLSRGHAESHGVAAIPYEFAKFRSFYAQLDPDTRREWREVLREDWTTAKPNRYTASLLDRLSDLS
jgi:tetratricopeptide (TPR) repeat protein